MSSQNSGKNSTHHSPKVASGATTQDPRAATQQVPPIADPVLQQAQAIQSAQRKPRPKKKDVEAQSDDANQVQALSDAGDSLPMGSDAASSWSLSADLVGESASESVSESVGDEWSGVPNRGDGDLLLAQASVSNNPTGAGMPSGAPSTGASMATAVFNPSFLVAGVAVASIAAGGGAAANHVVSAKIVLGQVLPGNDLKVHVFKVNNNTKPVTTDLAKADWTFDGSKVVAADGSFRLDLQGYQGLVKIVVRNGGDAKDYNDDLTDQQVNAPDGVDLAVAYANVGASASPINVNHVTTWIAKEVEEGDGLVNAKTLLAANNGVAKILQLEGKDLSTLPISPPEAGPVGDGDASKYGVFNAILYAAGVGPHGAPDFGAIGTNIDSLLDLPDTQTLLGQLEKFANRFLNSPVGQAPDNAGQIKKLLEGFNFVNVIEGKPVVNGLRVSDSTTPNNLGKAGESVSITVTVSEPVSVSAAATFTFQVGSSASDTFTATLSPIMSATNSFVLTGTLPAAGDGAIRLVGISGGTLLGAISTLSADYAQFQAVIASNYTVDNAGPNIAISGSSAPVFSLQASGSAVMRDIKAGEKAVLIIQLGEDAANLIGLPSGTVNTLVSVNSVNKPATWSTSGSQLLLTYTVEAGDNGTLSVDNTALKAELSGVTDRVGNALTFGGSSTGVFSVANAPFSVDTSEPASINLTGMLFTSTVGQHSQTAAGTLSAGVGSISLNASGTDEAFIFTLASALPAGVGVQWSTNNGTTWSDATTVSSTMIRIPANIVAGDTEFNPTLRFVDNALNASATSTLDITVTNDTTAPTLVSGVVNGSTLTLTFSEPIKTASGLVPTAADFTIVGNTINSISVSGSTIVLGLANPYLNGAAVGNLSYTNGNDVTDVQDAAGNELASFTGQSITNNTPPVPVLASVQPLSGLTNLDVTSKLVIPFSMPIALGSGKIYIKDGMGSAGWTVTNNDVANSTWTDTNDNDVEITLTNGAVTDLRIGGVSYSDLGMGSGPTRSTSVDVALTSGQIANYVTTSGNNLIIDIAPINNVRAAAAPWYGRGWTFDFDFGSSYHIEYEEGIVSSNGLATPALSDNTRLAFTTVTPLNTPAGATSQKFNDDGSLTAGYIWHNGSQGSGTQQSAAISLDFATGDHALVFQGNRYGLSSGNPVPPPANALLQTPVGGNVNVRNFLSGDVIYADNGGNMTLQTLEGRTGSSWSGTGVTTKMTYDASVNGSAQYIWFGSYSGSNITQLGGGNTQFESSTAMNSNAVIFG